MEPSNSLGGTTEKGAPAPKLSVFVPTLNRASTLADCFEGLRTQTLRDFEVIVVDGGSTDETTEVVESYRRHLNIVYRVKGGGLVAAANEALGFASGTVFCRTDDDAVGEPAWLETVWDTFQDGSIGGVTGPTLIPETHLEGRDLTYFNARMQRSSNLFWRILAAVYYGYFLEGQPYAVSRFFRSGAFALGSNYPSCLLLDDCVEAEHLEACNWSARTSLIREVGGFDPHFGGVGEYHEADVAYKIRGLGYRLVFNPRAVVHHRPSMLGVFKARPKAFGRSQNFVLFYFRHVKPSTVDKLVRFGSYLIFINCYWLFKAITSRNLQTLLGVPGTVAGLVRFLPELRNVSSSTRTLAGGQ